MGLCLSSNRIFLHFYDQSFNNQSSFSIVYYFSPKISLDLVQLSRPTRISITTNNMVDHIKAIDEIVNRSLMTDYEKYIVVVDKKRRKNLYSSW